MMKIEYSVTDERELNLISQLWQKLNEQHGLQSRYFSEDYPDRTRETRKEEFLNESRNGPMRIDLARDSDTGELAGYCVSTITRDKIGEIVSIYIESAYRSSGIGDALMKNALQWMNELSTKKKIVRVAAGNEEVHAFYSRYGFYPRSTILMQVDAGETGDSQ